MIKALIGLGNSGAEYEQTYHNVGVFVVQKLLHCESLQQLEPTLKKYPQSGFMNESGLPVRAWLKENNLLIGDCLVVHDDSDLPVGESRLVRGGGSAGHKGIESLVLHLGTEDFWRLRIGIRDPKEQVRKKAGDFVLRRWSGGEEQIFEKVAAEAAPGVAALTAKESL